MVTASVFSNFTSNGRLNAFNTDANNPRVFPATLLARDRR
jgi:hypothetical protein